MKNKFATLLALSFILLALTGCSGKKTAEYRAGMADTAEMMLNNKEMVGNVLDQYAKVWNYSIESRGAIPVDEMMAVTYLDRDTVIEYFTINSAGNIPADFSMNIHSMNSYFDKTGQLLLIKDAAAKVKERVADLNEPPAGYENVYEEVLDMYNLSEEYLEMALNPNGSYKSFNEDRTRLSSDLVSKFKRMEVILPKEK